MIRHTFLYGLPEAERFSVFFLFFSGAKTNGFFPRRLTMKPAFRGKIATKIGRKLC